MRRLLLDRVEPPFETDAPPNVVVAPWRQGDRLALHVLNVPSAMLRVDERSQVPEDFVPTGPIHISVKGTWGRVSSPTNPDQVHSKRKGDGLEITLERLEQHAVIVLDSETE